MDSAIEEAVTRAGGFYSHGAQLVTPGEVITSDASYMRGHGTYLDGAGNLRATIAGQVERLNRLVLVRPLAGARRYGGQVGDVVVGRVGSIGQKRWMVDVNGRQDAVLGLSSIPLPGGIQRRKSEQDELMMRQFFSEGQLVVCEVQTTFQDGALGLHTRNSPKYGKLLAGELIAVPSGLIRRSKSQFATMEWGVEVIFGLNGLIWVGKPRMTSKSNPLLMGAFDEGSEENMRELYSNDVPACTPDERSAIVRTRNVIHLLQQHMLMVDEESVRRLYRAILQHHPHMAPFDIVRAENAAALAALL